MNANPARPAVPGGPVDGIVRQPLPGFRGGKASGAPTEPSILRPAPYQDSGEGTTDLPGTVPTFQGGNRPICEANASPEPRKTSLSC